MAARLQTVPRPCLSSAVCPQRHLHPGLITRAGWFLVCCEQGVGRTHPGALTQAQDMGLNELWAFPSSDSVTASSEVSRVACPGESLSEG